MQGRDKCNAWSRPHAADLPCDEGSTMAIRLNSRALAHAKQMIRDGKVVNDERDAWSEHKASAAKEDEFIRNHGFFDYGKWYLGLDDEKDPETKAHYRFPYGDFFKVHRCGVLSAESKTAQDKHKEIEDAFHDLHEMMETAKK